MPGYANPFANPGPIDPHAFMDPNAFNEDYYLNADPEAGFWRYLKGLGMDDQSQPGKYAQAQYQPTYNKYRAVAASDPNMGFFDYLKKNLPDFTSQYASQSPEQRGDYSSRLNTPRARWVSG